jgi:hypothetical protein
MMTWLIILCVLAVFDIQLSNHIGVVERLVPPSVVCLFWWAWE